jgi:hypothetical protein
VMRKLIFFYGIQAINPNNLQEYSSQYSINYTMLLNYLSETTLQYTSDHKLIQEKK